MKTLREIPGKRSYGQGYFVCVRTDFQITNLGWDFLIDWITIILTGS